MKKVILFIVITTLWYLLLKLFSNQRMFFFKFLVGTIGIFTISMVFFLPYLEGNLNDLISETFARIEKLTKDFEVFKDNYIISVNTRSGMVSILINYECSGIIEMLVFTSLAIFFPFGTNMRKIFSVILGNLYIYVANVIRVLFIIYITKTFGSEAFYLAHTLFARILFFVLMIILYYFVFTTTQLRYQSVGDIK